MLRFPAMNTSAAAIRTLFAAAALLAAVPGSGDTPGASPDAAANAFFERAFEERLVLEPTTATSLGLKTGADRWQDSSEAGEAERFALSKRQVEELRAMDPARLDDATRLSWQVFEAGEERRMARYPWRNHGYFFDKDGAHASVPAFLINTHRIESEADAVTYIRRLEGVQPLFAQQLERARAAAKQGIAPPKFVYPYVIEDAGNVIKGLPFDVGPADSVLLADFRAKVGKLEIDDARRQALVGEAVKALLGSVKPAYEAVIAWSRETEKSASTDDGVWRLPDGAAYYDYLLKNFTTTDLTAAQIHEIGLREVARIHDEMRVVMKRVGFEGDLSDFFDFMRTDAQFYYPDTAEGREAWLADANRHIVAMRAKLPELFVTLPKAEVVVKAVEPFREKSAGKAFYQRPSQDGSRPGVFYGNLYQMKEMPKYELEALTYHEAIPGHHMQNAIALEESSLPRFRRSGVLHGLWRRAGASTASGSARNSASTTIPGPSSGASRWNCTAPFVSWWTPGLHAKRWTREQTIRYHVENSPTGEDAAIRATERYILNPGQATAYMIGMLKIVELRERAAAALGPKFDKREFHDLVLRTGSVPLTVLESEVQRWVDGAEGLRSCAPTSSRSVTSPPGTWSYVVADPAARKCAVVDPVLDFDPKSGRASTASADAIASFVRDSGLTYQWILETHAHADHLSAAPWLQAALGGKIAIGEGIRAVQTRLP